jgi:hypothetical protein
LFKTNAWNGRFQSWFITDLFPIRTPLFWGSTGDKQTSKGLFICLMQASTFSKAHVLQVFTSALFSLRWLPRLRDEMIMIRTFSKPHGVLILKLAVML